METFCAGKLARKENGCFQSTKVKSRTELKCHVSLRVKVKPRYGGGALSSSVCSLKSLLMIAVIEKVLCSFRIIGKNLYVDLAALFISSKRRSDRAPVAQLVEHRAVTREVAGSNPGQIFSPDLKITEEKVLPFYFPL